MSRTAPTLVWFRNDLRLADNPALHDALQDGRPVILLYVLDTVDNGQRALGGAAQWWLHHTLASLAKSLEARGGHLTLRRGDPAAIIESIVEAENVERVVWNRRYDEAGRTIDARIKSSLSDRGVTVESFNGSLLTEPWTLKTGSGAHYKVFTPYWRAVQATYYAPAPLSVPETLSSVAVPSDALDDWQLLPRAPDWAAQFPEHWQPGEAGAHDRLNRFLNGPVNGYTRHRDRPDLETSTSGLSPYLRWGEIGPRQIWRAVQARISDGAVREDDGLKFLSEIGWREFSYVLLYHNADLATDNYKAEFAQMPWRNSAQDFKAWREGRTGYPIVDAGMRQLWATGWMHNRVRMIAASFLTKHLLLPWQDGEAWFWDTLVDADPASNPASWQWVAGSGADAAPYFRIFNPITQGEKFDQAGDYVRRWCPELAGLPDKYLFAPWRAPEGVLQDADVELCATYPAPIIDHMSARHRALEAYDMIKQFREAS